MTAFLIDFAIIGIIAFCGWRGYKNGLIRGVFGVVSLIAAIIISNAAAQAYSKEATYIIMPFVNGLVDSVITNPDDEEPEYQPELADHDIDDPVFIDAYTVFRKLHIPDAAAVTMAKDVAETTDIVTPEENRQAFIDILAEKITNSMSFIAVFGIAFLILAIIFAVIGNLLGFVFSLPGLKLVDIIAGSVFGLAKGFIIVFTLALVVRYLGIIALPLVESTTILNSLITGNPIADMLGL